MAFAVMVMVPAFDVVEFPPPDLSIHWVIVVPAVILVPVPFTSLPSSQRTQPGMERGVNGVIASVMRERLLVVRVVVEMDVACVALVRIVLAV
jgi:hypothetical protein